MNTFVRFSRWAPVLGFSALFAAGPAPAAVSLQGDVTLDYYVAGVDAEGFENEAAAFHVDEVANDGAATSGPLSLSGWATGDPDPAGAGDEVGYDPLGPLPPNTSLLNVDDTVGTDDLRPGEYYAHVLLQDDSAPGTFEDNRTLSPRLLWRGGLEAVGPLQVTPYGDGSHVTVDFAELRNNRLDSRYSNDIALTLYATYGHGPASDGYTLCRSVAPGLYAGDYASAPSFDCALGALPDGDYTVHLEVAEIGGRGGGSTLSGPDVYFRGDRASLSYCCGTGEVAYASGALAPALLLPLALAALRRRRRHRH